MKLAGGGVSVDERGLCLTGGGSEGQLRVVRACLIVEGSRRVRRSSGLLPSRRRASSEGTSARDCPRMTSEGEVACNE